MLSVVIIAHNEEAGLERAISSVSWADEVVVINNGSTDNTAAIAKKLKCRIISDTTQGDFSALRNHGLQEARGPWVFFLDADEEVSPALAMSIQNALSYEENPYTAYSVSRSDIFWGHTLLYGETYWARARGIMRLVKKNTGVHWVGRVHERLVVPGLCHARLDGYLIHRPHQSISSFLEHINTYSTIRARELADTSPSHPWISYVKLFSFPLLKFIYTYIFLLGVADGAAGFVYSFMMSFHSFLVRAKWYQFTHLKDA
jgi:glycosyltransferase involved in cell wall biosynthesis